NKYGTFICEPHLSFPNQVFPSNPSDAPPGSYRQNGGEEEPEDPYVGDRSMDEHYGGSTIMAYDPLFNWDSERAAVIGHRLPIRPITSPSVGTRFSVRILGLTVQAGLVEPVSGTMCLYHAERREKASEDFHFQFLPPQWEGESTSPDTRAIFSVDKESAALCLLVQLEKAASEESVNGIKPAVYTRKDPPTLTDKEAARLSEWAQVMPFREPLAWITIPLFDSSVTGGVGGFGSSGGGSSGGGSSGSLGGGGGVLGVEGSGGAGSSPVVDSNGVRVPAYELGGPPVQIDIPTLNRAKECYTDDQLLDPKKKAQKPVRVSMHFEVERLPGGAAGGAAAGGSVTPRSLSSSASQRGVNRARSQDSMTSDMDDVNMVPRSLSVSRFLSGFQAIDFTDMVRAEPFTRLVHLLFVYPQQVALPKKLNLFVRTELRADDLDIQRPSMEAIFPKERNGPMLRTASTQVVQGARPALFHDEVKMQLPASVSPSHHLLFTFFHIDLSLRSERPKPVAVGYAVMPLAAALQAFKAEVNLPISKDLQPRYLQESTKSRLTYWEEGRPIFRVRTRLFSSLLPLSDRLRDFFHQFDRHMLEAPLPREDLLEAINALKTVDVVVLMQFLYPLLNMLLCMIGNGVETLQVAAFRAMINIVSRVQLELAPQSGAAPMERSRFLVHFVDFIFDDLGRNQPPVYPGLSNVWRSLARSKSRGFRVGPVYAEALQMAWFVLELIVKSMDLELAQVPQGDEIARLRLEDEVFLCIRQLFECLLAEVHEKAVSDPPLAKSLSSSISFFCYDLISVVDPPQVFELVSALLLLECGCLSQAIHSSAKSLSSSISFFCYDLISVVDPPQVFELVSALLLLECGCLSQAIHSSAKSLSSSISFFCYDLISVVDPPQVFELVSALLLLECGCLSQAIHSSAKSLSSSISFFCYDLISVVDPPQVFELVSALLLLECGCLSQAIHSSAKSLSSSISFFCYDLISVVDPPQVFELVSALLLLECGCLSQAIHSSAKSLSSSISFFCYDLISVVDPPQVFELVSALLLLECGCLSQAIHSSAKSLSSSISFFCYDLISVVDPPQVFELVSALLLLECGCLSQAIHSSAKSLSSSISFFCYDLISVVDPPQVFELVSALLLLECGCLSQAIHSSAKSLSSSISFFCYDLISVVDPPQVFELVSALLLLECGCLSQAIHSSAKSLSSSISFFCYDLISVVDPPQVFELVSALLLLECGCLSQAIHSSAKSLSSSISFFCYDLISVVDPPQVFELVSALLLLECGCLSQAIHSSAKSLSSSISFFCYDLISVVDPPQVFELVSALLLLECGCLSQAIHSSAKSLSSSISFFCYDLISVVDPPQVFELVSALLLLECGCLSQAIHSSAKSLSSSISFFCYDLISVVDPPQVFELVSALLLLECGCLSQAIHSSAKSLSSSISFFCYDLISVVDPPQVFELVSALLLLECGCLSQAIHSSAKSLSSSISFFCYDLISVVDPPQVFELVSALLLLECGCLSQAIHSSAKSLSSSISFFCYDLISVVDPPQVFELVSALLLLECGCLSQAIHSSAKSLSSSISFFCYDLISVVDPPQVFELAGLFLSQFMKVSPHAAHVQASLSSLPLAPLSSLPSQQVGLFLSQFVGVCPPMQHMFKLHFLRIVCDHDLYIETPGRGPTEKNYLTTVLLKDLFVSLDHEDPSQRSLAARMLAFQVAKHEYDARYQQPELKLYIAQLYMPIVNMILDEVETFNTLGVIQRRQILVVMLTVVRNLDNETLLKAWKQSDVRTRLFFTLLQQALVLFQHPPQLTAGSKPRPTGTKSSPATSAPTDATLAVEPSPIPMYSDRVSLATNDQLDEMARADPKAMLEREQIIRKVTGGAVSGGKGSTVSLRDVLSRSRIPPKDAMALMRQNLPSSASAKLLTWEASVAAWCAVQVLEVVEKFSDMAADGLVATDYQTMDCLTGPLSVMLALPQPMSFWEPFVPAFAEMLRLHGKAMLDGPPSSATADIADSGAGGAAAAKGGDVLLKDLFGSLLRQMAVRPEFIRKRALLCLLLLLRVRTPGPVFLMLPDRVPLSSFLNAHVLLKNVRAVFQVEESSSQSPSRNSSPTLACCTRPRPPQPAAPFAQPSPISPIRFPSERPAAHEGRGASQSHPHSRLFGSPLLHTPPALALAHTPHTPPFAQPSPFLFLQNALLHMRDVERLRVILTVALSEVLSRMRLLHSPSPSNAPASRSSSASSVASAAGGAGGGAGELVESAEVEKLRLSLEELGTEDKWFQLLDECGLPSICLEIVVEEDEEKEEEEDEEDEEEEYEEWDEGGTSQHEQLMEGLKTSNDKYAIVESYYILAQAYGHVPDLYIMWMLHLCDAHQEMNQWAEAAQCAVSVAGIVIRGLQIASQEPVWDEEHLEVLWSICPLARHQWRARAFSSQSGFGAARVTVEGAVQHVQRASNLFYKAELFHFCALMLSLLLPLHRTRHDYKQLTKTHNKIASIYENVEQQETSPIPFKDACYYRVGFYGERFRYIDGREFIYREPRDVRLGDIMEKLKALYDARSLDEEPLQIIQDSRQVDPAALKPNLVYMQITAVEPVVGAGEDRWLGRPLEPPIAGTPTFSCFFFDTPFTPNGKQQGRMEDQWKRRTLLYTQSTLPSLISRQPVVRSEVREYSPIQCAVEIIESRSFALEAEMASQLGDCGAAGAAGGPAGKKDPAAVVAAAMAAGSGPLQLPRLQTLQRLLQGSVALQVNSGVLGVCMAFYQANPQGANPRAKDPEKLQPSELEMLTAAIVRFVVVCKRAVVVHGRAVTEEDRDFQEQLEQSLEDLEKEISAFIPGLRKRASAY
ncbi:unnamed protein product, partial [Closterium sp. Yama58-4]